MKPRVVIVGGGPAGSASALFLRQLGIDSVIVEKVPFPRYHIGESMTGECGGLLRALGLEEEMLRRRYPVKHGVKVFGRNSWFVPVMARRPDGSLMEQATWQVRRSDFDSMLLDTAVSRGATLVRGQATRPLRNDDGSVRGVEVRRPDGGLQEIESEVLLDCSGQGTFLAAAGVTGPKYLGSYDKQIAIFSQIRGGIRDAGDSSKTAKDNTLIFYKKKFHWAWWIPIDDEVVSVGIVCPAAYFRDRKESKAAFVARELHELHPELKRRIPRVELVEEARAFPNYSYQVRDFCGKGFICLGDAHRFVDPIFSFGLFVAIKEAQLAAPHVKAYLDGANRDAANPFAVHQLCCEKAIDCLEDALDTFWEHPLSFAMTVHLRDFEGVVDVFAGRIYGERELPILSEFRTLLGRERLYGESDADYSVPIGSRYHPERAPLWEEEPETGASLPDRWPAGAG